MVWSVFQMLFTYNFRFHRFPSHLVDLEGFLFNFMKIMQTKPSPPVPPPPPTGPPSRRDRQRVPPTSRLLGHVFASEFSIGALIWREKLECAGAYVPRPSPSKSPSLDLSLDEAITLAKSLVMIWNSMNWVSSGGQESRFSRKGVLQGSRLDRRRAISWFASENSLKRRVHQKKEDQNMVHPQQKRKWRVLTKSANWTSN